MIVPMEYLMAVEMGEKWNIYGRRAAKLYSKEHVEGTVKKDKT